MTRVRRPLMMVFVDYKGLVHRAVHVMRALGEYYGEADCDWDLEGRTLQATRTTPLTCVRCLGIR